MIGTLTAILLAVIIAVVTAIATAMIRDEVMDRLKAFPEWITGKIMQLHPGGHPGTGPKPSGSRICDCV